MNVLILGVNGFIGPATAYYATLSGHRVIGLGRSGECSFSGISSYVAGDRRDTSFVQTVLKQHDIDVVVDVIPMTLADTGVLLDCLDDRIDQYVMISSCDVYTNYELLNKQTTGRPRPESVDENSALRTIAFPYRSQTPRGPHDPDQYLDEYDKIPIEHAVRQLYSSWTILRLPMVYGPGDKQRRFRWAIEPMLKGAERLTLPRAWCEWKTTYGYIDNVGAAIARTIGDPLAARRIFNIAEPNPLSQLKWVQKFSRVLDWRGEIMQSEDPDDPFARRLSGLDLSVHLNINGNRFRETFAFSDPVEEPVALKKTIDGEAAYV